MRSTISPAALGPESAEELVRRLDAGRFELPDAISVALRQIVDELRLGNEVTVLSSSSVLTTAEAAELLNVSRPHVVKLVDEGRIAHHMAGSHRRLYLADVLAYKAEREAAGREALAQIQELADEAGMDL